MKCLNIFYDLDDTLVESLDLFFFVDNLLAWSYLKKINKDEKRIDFEGIYTELQKYSFLKKVIENKLNNLNPELKKEIEEFKQYVRTCDDKIMEEWPKMHRNPFSPEGLMAALEQVIYKYNLNLGQRDLYFASQIPFHYNLKTKEPLLSIKELSKESLEYKVNIFIFSKGSFKEQVKKIEYLKLQDLIPLENIFILHKKDSKILQEISELRGINQALMVGNSLKEEIQPALELKEMFKVLWVKHDDYFSKNLTIDDNIEIFSLESFKNYIRKQLYE
ncbi:MAG: hypothetical protein PWP03_256 [Candidatus Woesearchaeota archaeon]|nr:hypothetical protein [Candidatus Woesearchaeota archaeon]MDN5327618.1 hypothetical protein [Candidatus Woesearchaeota archaeon]